jgi:transglutaminase-like putative cysteine protease
VTVYRVRHETVYRYDGSVVTSHNEARLLPRRLSRQEVSRVELRIDPNPDTVQWHQDYFGNDVVFFTLHVPHECLAIRTDSEVELHPDPPFDPSASAPWERVVEEVRASRGESALQAFEFAFDSPFVEASDELAAYARPSFPAGRRLAEGVLDLMHRIHADFTYDPGATTLDTSLPEVLRERRGVCQDFAHLMIGGLRSLGLPARYVSGYLRSRRAPGPGDAAASEDAATLVGSEASHAWVSVWCPSLGWFDVDPTNDLVPSDRHVVLAWGRDYDDVSPVKGVTLGGGYHTVEVSVEVAPRESAAGGEPHGAVPGAGAARAPGDPGSTTR